MPDHPHDAIATPNAPRGTFLEVLAVFARLGLTSFGGPVAHLGYFRTECVERRRWLDDAAYADLVALCQFLPGPASSQVGIGLGYRRAGWPGAFAAWLGFTLPSAIALAALRLRPPGRRRRRGCGAGSAVSRSSRSPSSRTPCGGWRPS